MLRNSLPLLSRPSDYSTRVRAPSPAPGPAETPQHQRHVPTIRLISATPSAAGSSEPNSSFAFTPSADSIPANGPWGSVPPVPSVPSPLAPKSKVNSDAPRKKLVPKKSKLGLLGAAVSGTKEKTRAKNDFSDVVRRVGGDTSLSSSRGGGFEIYIDPTLDPDIGEILMVKKKKSRAALDGVWNTDTVKPVLGEVSTNMPAQRDAEEEGRGGRKEARATLKVKGDEKEGQKWWSIGRGRKDSKEKTKEKENAQAQTTRARSKTPEPFKPVQNVDSRARFNSLDSGVLLNSPINGPPGWTRSSSPDPALRVFEPPQRSATPTAGGLLAPPGAANNNSIALRAMRSVKSLARIGSWAQLQKTGDEGGSDSLRMKTLKEKDGMISKTDIGEPKKTKKKKGKDKTKEKAQEKKAATMRISTSSFEVGALSASPEHTATSTRSLGKKKQSILGLGLPSTVRLPSVRGGSSASSTPSLAPHRLSMEGAIAIKPIITVPGRARDRNGSTMSTTSSLRPVSVVSSSTQSSGTTGPVASVKWDEQVLEHVKEQRKRERLEMRMADGGKESRRSAEGRRRTSLASIFPETAASVASVPVIPEHDNPIVTVEEATVDGHDREEDAVKIESLETPNKKSRVRPMSEQLIGKSRPQAMYNSDDGVISMLDAATNDLAQLINRLDLEATPCTPDESPMMRASPFVPRSGDDTQNQGSVKPGVREQESPLKKGSLRLTMSSISSLRPYAQSRGKTSSSQPLTTAAGTLLDDPIMPWPVLNRMISIEKPTNVAESPKVTVSPLRLKRKTMLPSSPARIPDPEPPFKPLQPAKSRKLIAMVKVIPASPAEDDHIGPHKKRLVGSPSSQTFGSVATKSDSSLLTQSGSPVFKKAHSHVRKRSSLIPPENRNSRSNTNRDSLPIPPEAKRVLGLTGTMGGSEASGYTPPELDASDPDSDIPDELQMILAGNSDDGETLSQALHSDDPVVPSSPGSPPDEPLPPPGPNTSPASDIDIPVFRAQLIDDEDNHADIEEGGHSSEDDTKKSFDFTGELQKLNESGGSDRLSFLEQLENAFRTPAKIDLDFGVSLQQGSIDLDVSDTPPPPPPPTLDVHAENTVDASSGCSMIGANTASITRIIDVSMPSDVHCSESEDDMSNLREALQKQKSLRPLKSSSSMVSRPSDGQLNLEFKFGGRPLQTETKEKMEVDKPLTLSDIIPPIASSESHSLSPVEEDSSVLKSIFAKVSDLPHAPPVPVPRPRVSSDSSSKRFMRESFHSSANRHSRHSSEMSFAGLDSFAEIRRGFEFHDNRPGFYPPVTGATSRSKHAKQESMISFASVSSFGRVINPGCPDPFDYGVPPLLDRSDSDDVSLSMSTSVDDTFSFIHHNQRRRRVDSDTSSFYFRGPRSSILQPYSRRHSRHESGISITSMAAPPISLYNRSFGGHRRNDSSTSVSSVAQSYAMHGANGGRAAWARHKQDPSVDSVMSDFSAMRLGRPGLGDKMLESGMERGMPLTAISASPPESVASQYVGRRSSFDSIIDYERQPSAEDSLFEKTGHRTSVSSESLFADNHDRPVPSKQFRPLSTYSMINTNGPVQEDDTMITMLGGGHIRRASVGSLYEASPCVRVGKRKHSVAQEHLPAYKLTFDDVREVDSPNKARIIERPSIISTASTKFGGERMIRAQHGLLERQSLEESCLVADGEDMTTSFVSRPVFTRPGPTSRSRSSTCTSSSGVETPPLSISDGSSISGGSQSSIDLSSVNIMLSNVTHPITNHPRNHTRIRDRGDGHRRRVSQARLSRASVYETIQEELASLPNSPSKKDSMFQASGPFIVDPETASLDIGWDEEHGIGALRKYYALKNEAHHTVTESKVMWPDTQFSIFALQSFSPPHHSTGMQALLEYSQQNYGPLPFELHPRRVRSRTQSRPSPYPPVCSKKTSLSPSQPRPFAANADEELNYLVPGEQMDQPLQQVLFNPNILSPSRDSMLDINSKLKQTSPLILDAKQRENVNVIGLPRPRVPSNTRRTALGWSKRSTGSTKNSTGFENKENVAYGQGNIMTPGESLRIKRPRPKGRQTPAAGRPIRV